MVNGVDISPRGAAEAYARDNYWPQYPETTEEEVQRRLREILCVYHGVGCATPESQ